MKTKVLKGIKRIIAIIIILVGLIIITGIAYENIGLYIDSHQYIPPGKMLDINGHNLHVYPKGAGNSTVVFISGFGTPSPYADFYPLYDDISKYARVVITERPGYGFSEVTSQPRNIDTIAQELHEALVQSEEMPPYIFVAHSMGSLEAIRYTQMYQDEVSGIVMIDGGNPEYYANDIIDQAFISSMKLKGTLKNLGVIRLLFNHSESFYKGAYSARNHLSNVPQNIKDVDTAMYLRTLTNKNKTEELIRLQENGLIVMENGYLGEVPLRILTSELEATDENWKRSQEGFKSWSTNSIQKEIKSAPHYIHHYQSQEVINEILDLIHSIDAMKSVE